MCSLDSDFNFTEIYTVLQQVGKQQFSILDKLGPYSLRQAALYRETKQFMPTPRGRHFFSAEMHVVLCALF